MVSTFGQSPVSARPPASIVKAKYLNGDPGEILEKKIRYPQEAVIANIQGDVILSSIIDKRGRTEQVTAISSPGNSLSEVSVSALNDLKEGWSPALVDDEPVDKTYLIIFRYRIYINSRPPDYTKIGKRLAEKQKYEKALKTWDLAIKDNRYRYEYFEERSLIKKTLGDDEGAESDEATARELYDQILTVVDVITIGYTKTVVKKVVVATPAY